jgi:hypothetical protein
MHGTCATAALASRAEQVYYWFYTWHWQLASQNAAADVAIDGSQQPLQGELLQSGFAWRGNFRAGAVLGM